MKTKFRNWPGNCWHSVWRSGLRTWWKALWNCWGFYSGLKSTDFQTGPFSCSPRSSTQPRTSTSPARSSPSSRRSSVKRPTSSISSTSSSTKSSFSTSSSATATSYSSWLRTRTASPLCSLSTTNTSPTRSSGGWWTAISTTSKRSKRSFMKPLNLSKPTTPPWFSGSQNSPNRKTASLTLGSSTGYRGISFAAMGQVSKPKNKDYSPLWSLMGKRIVLRLLEDLRRRPWACSQ